MWAKIAAGEAKTESSKAESTKGNEVKPQSMNAPSKNSKNGKNAVNPSTQANSSETAPAVESEVRRTSTFFPSTHRISSCHQQRPYSANFSILLSNLVSPPTHLVIVYTFLTTNVFSILILSQVKGKVAAVSQPSSLPDGAVWGRKPALPSTTKASEPATGRPFSGTKASAMGGKPPLPPVSVTTNKSEQPPSCPNALIEVRPTVIAPVNTVNTQSVKSEPEKVTMSAKVENAAADEGASNTRFSDEETPQQAGSAAKTPVLNPVSSSCSAAAAAKLVEQAAMKLAVRLLTICSLASLSLFFYLL